MSDSVLLDLDTIKGNIKLYESTWYDHIVYGHPEMDGRLGDVEKTLIDPDVIHEGNAKDSESLFVREYIKHDVRVATRFLDTGYHIVTTAYTGNPAFPNKGKVVWQG